MNEPRFVDLFCGIGGFHQALSQLGGKCVWACDIDASCRNTYHANYGLQPESDITRIPASEIPAHDILCAGFPCQSFSKAGKRNGFADTTKGTLFFDVLRILDYHKPEFAILENVRNLASHDGGNTWRVIHKSLTETGYSVSERPVIFSPHYIGIPQHRERVFILCVRSDKGEVPAFDVNTDNTPVCSVESVLQEDSEISNLNDYRLSNQQIELIDIWNEFIQGIVTERLPGYPIWSEYLRPLDEIKRNTDYTSRPDWAKKFIEKNALLYQTNAGFIDGWLMRAKRNPLFFGAKAKLEWQAGQTHRPDIWKNILQMRPSGIRVKPSTYFPALVAITQTSIVGSRRRFITPRECARLQSFPDTFTPDAKDTQAYKQFGNSVNVEVVKLFARILLNSSQTL